MKIQLDPSPSFAQQLRQVADAPGGSIPAKAALMVQLAHQQEVPAGLSRTDVFKHRAHALKAALSSLSARLDAQAWALSAAAAKAQTTLRVAAELVDEQTKQLEAAAMRVSSGKPPKAPPPEVARAFLARFAAEGTKGGRRGAQIRVRPPDRTSPCLVDETPVRPDPAGPGESGRHDNCFLRTT